MNDSIDAAFNPELARSKLERCGELAKIMDANREARDLLCSKGLWCAAYILSDLYAEQLRPWASGFRVHPEASLVLERAGLLEHAKLFS